MKNTRIMVNQPIGGCQGSWVDVNIQAAEQNRNLKARARALAQRGEEQPPLARPPQRLTRPGTNKRRPQLTVEVLEKVTGLPRDTLEEAVDRELFLSAPPAPIRRPCARLGRPAVGLRALWGLTPLSLLLLTSVPLSTQRRSRRSS